MHLYANLRPGPKFQPARAAFYYAQRLATVPFVRNGVSRILSAAINVRQAGHESDDATGLPSRHLGQALSQLRNKGIARLDGFITDSAISSISSYFSDKQLISDGVRYNSLGSLPPGLSMASYSLDCVLGCPEIIDLLNRPALLHLARQYLGCCPTISSLGVRWSFPGSTDLVDTQCFHRDYDDWRFFKLFVYLTDVDAGSGPHVFVTGSHRTAGRLRAKPYPTDAIEKQFGRNAIQTMIGPAGTVFVADTYGIHRGAVPSLKPRLILQAGYSLLPIFAFRYQPVLVGWRPKVDAYVNRLLLE